MSAEAVSKILAEAPTEMLADVVSEILVEVEAEAASESIFFPRNVVVPPTEGLVSQ